MSWPHFSERSNRDENSLPHSQAIPFPLARLVAGEPWRLSTLVSELRWQREQAGVSKTLSQLTGKGLVERVRWKGRRVSSRQPLRPIGYRITAAGKRAWAESGRALLFPHEAIRRTVNGAPSRSRPGRETD